MKTLITIISILVFWVMMSAWHSVRPDMEIVGVEASNAENAAILYQPTRGFWKVRSAMVIKSESIHDKYCVWYVKSWELPDFVWDEMRKQGRLKCK